MKTGSCRWSSATNIISIVLILTWLAPGGLCADETISAPNLKRVVVVFKTHFDIGFTDMAANVVQRYQTSMIDKALQVIEESETLPPEHQFKWTLPGWPMTQIYKDWPGQTAQRQAKLREAFQQDRLVLHALPFTTHTEMNELETLVRGLEFSARLSRQAGKPLPRAAKMTDVPSHSWIMPTLLKHAGIDFLHLGCNAGSSSPEVPLMFWWEGPDGSRLLTFYVAGGYGTSIVPPKNWPHETWLALIMTGDNHGPPTIAEVKKLLDQAQHQLPHGVEVTFGRMENFADAIIAEKPNLPVVRGDMPDTWIHGPMSNPRGIALSRKVGPKIAAAESLETLLLIWLGRQPKTTETITAAYEQALLYGEHTWGASLGWVKRKLDYGNAWRDAMAQGKYQRHEASWEEHTDYIRKANDLIKPVLADELKTLAASVAVEGPRVVVFNPLPWPRDGLAVLPSEYKINQILRDVQTGQAVPIAQLGNEQVFLAQAVPSQGYRTYVPLDLPPDNAAPGTERVPQGTSVNTIESRYFQATLDPQRGVITALIDKHSGDNLIETSKGQALGQYIYERFGRKDIERWDNEYIKLKVEWALTGIGKPDVPAGPEYQYRVASPHGFDLQIQRSTLGVTAIMHAKAQEGIPHAVTTSLTLYNDFPYADLALTLHDKPADPWPEGGWLALPFKVDNPRYRLGRLGGVIDPAKDIVAGANHDMLWLNFGAAVIDQQGKGVGMCPLDSPLISLDRPGLWQYSPRRTSQSSHIYINLYNNMWSTNFRLWNSGTWTSRVRIWAIKEYDAEPDLVTPSWQARSPLLAASSDLPDGRLPPLQSGLQLSHKGVLVTAFGFNAGNEGLILRLWEQAGRNGECTVTLPAGLDVKTVLGVDLRGSSVGTPITVTNGAWSTPLQANAPQSFNICLK